MKLTLKALPLLLALALGAPGAQADGVNVGKTSTVAKLVPAAQMEEQAVQQYEQLKQQAAAKQALGPDNHPEVIRLRNIARRIFPFPPVLTTGPINGSGQ